jgi:hypothetical protein
LTITETPASDDSFLIALGTLVIDWNFAEGWMGTLLSSLVEPSDTAKILTAELGSVGLENALTAFANHIVTADQGDAIKHAVKMFARLRGHRNYYIHAVVFQAGDPPVGYTHSQSAKGRLKLSAAVVTKELVLAAASLCRDLGRYVQKITASIHGDGQVPLPDKPPLPPEVDKESPYLQSL